MTIVVITHSITGREMSFDICNCGVWKLRPVHSKGCPPPLPPQYFKEPTERQKMQMAKERSVLQGTRVR